jgi:hypothetical protein
MSLWRKLKAWLFGDATAIPMPEVQPTAFRIGDRIGHTSGDGAVQIELTEVNEVQIKATVVVLGDFYCSDHLTGEHDTSHGFVLGETLIFWRSTRDSWNIGSPANKPWHILYRSINGDKTFEHYR